MYATQGKFREALQSLAQDAYYSSLDVGPDNVVTAGAYYHMGGAFLAQVRAVLQRWGDGAMGRCGDVAMWRCGDGVMGRWGDGAMGRLQHLDGKCARLRLPVLIIVLCCDSPGRPGQRVGDV